MKHAILILSSYGIDYLIGNIKQYQDYENVFDIFVHVDGQTFLEINEIRKNDGLTAIEYLYRETGMRNIKYVGHEYRSKRYSFELILSEMHLFRRAIEIGTYQAYHVTSESCFLYKDIDVFLDFYDRNPDINLIGLQDLGDKNIYDESTGVKIPYKGPQWFSLSHKTLSRIIEARLFENILCDWENKLIAVPQRIWGALDEMVLQSYIANLIFSDKDSENFWQARYVLWGDVGYSLRIGSPNTLVMEIFDSEIQLNEWELNNSFWCRKIDCKNESSLEFLDYLKKNYGKIKIER